MRKTLLERLDIWLKDPNAAVNKKVIEELNSAHQQNIDKEKELKNRVESSQKNNKNLWLALGVGWYVLVGIALMFIFLYNLIERKYENLDHKISTQINYVNKRIDVQIENSIYREPAQNSSRIKEHPPIPVDHQALSTLIQLLVSFSKYEDSNVTPDNPDEHIDHEN